MSIVFLAFTVPPSICFPVPCSRFSLRIITYGRLVSSERATIKGTAPSSIPAISSYLAVCGAMVVARCLRVIGSVLAFLISM